MSPLEVGMQRFGVKSAISTVTIMVVCIVAFTLALAYTGFILAGTIGSVNAGLLMASIAGFAVMFYVTSSGLQKSFGYSSALTDSEELLKLGMTAKIKNMMSGKSGLPEGFAGKLPEGAEIISLSEDDLPPEIAEQLSEIVHKLAEAGAFDENSQPKKPNLTVVSDNTKDDEDGDEA